MDVLQYFLCGVGAGLLSGLLGVGGGALLAPALTLLMGLNIRQAAPISVTAVVANSFVASNQYLKKGLVDLELVVIVGLVMVMGSITGSYLSPVIPPIVTHVALALILLFTAIHLVFHRQRETETGFVGIRHKRFGLSVALSLFIGGLAGLIGIGGGEVLVPLLYSVAGVPFATARGTTSVIVGYSAAAACGVYFFYDQINLIIVAPVVCGMIIGGKTGGVLGTRARPSIVKALYVAAALYLAVQLTWNLVETLL